MKPEHDEFHTHLIGDGSFAIYDGEGTTIYGFRCLHYTDPPGIALNDDGACYGMVLTGALEGDHFHVTAGHWFTTANGLRATMSGGTLLFVAQRRGYRGMDVIGLLEAHGRLKYIDGAMDSILFGPIKRGDPIINALYMPPGVHQTMHTHPSTRAGVIISGEAQAETRKGAHPLRPGMAFFLPANGWHKFRTDISLKPLTLFAYHPDSDFGPTDQDHPMLNRTMVGGRSAKDMPQIQTQDKDPDLSPA
jgi:mannose-6-phosphate isomerase-like protein (cupin superfamily)